MVYADVSGKKKDEFIVTGAYVAGEHSWRKFERAWGKILKDAGMGVFHATDFFGYHGEYFSWRDERVGSVTKQAHFAKRFTGAAARHTAFGAAFGIHRQHYDEILERELRGLHRPDARVDAETYSVVNCLAHIHRAAGKRGLRMPMAVILEEGGRSGDVVAVLNKLKEVGTESWTQRFVSFTTLPKSERALQAADLLAYETWLHITRLVNPDGRAVRKAMQSLVARGTIDVGFADREILAAQVPKVILAMKLYRPRE